MTELTRFGKDISKQLIELNKEQKWLVEQVKEKTGLYFDASYLHKIKTGKVATPKIVAAICEILHLKYKA